jgi:cyclophilin family peptidyl-prolyl cis-trans isomerase
MSLASLPTSGRVLIQTTLGDIEVELWSKVSQRAPTNGNVTEFGHRNVQKRVEILLRWLWKVFHSPALNERASYWRCAGYYDGVVFHRLGPLAAIADRIPTRAAELFRTLWSKRATARAQAMAVTASMAVRRSTDQGVTLSAPVGFE